MRTPTPLAFAISALLLVATSGCKRDHDADDKPAPAADTSATVPAADVPPATAPAPADANAAPTQAEALALVNTVNDHEMKLAEQAKSKHVSGDVMAYANMMSADHGKNMADTTALLDKNGGMPADSAKVNEMKAKGDAETTQLATLEGHAYEHAYIDAMVNGHTEVLGKLDTVLIPAATDAAVKAHLQATRDAVQKHLEKAKSVQASLKA